MLPAYLTVKQVPASSGFNGFDSCWDFVRKFDPCSIPEAPRQSWPGGYDERFQKEAILFLPVAGSRPLKCCQGHWFWHYHPTLPCIFHFKETSAGIFLPHMKPRHTKTQLVRVFLPPVSADSRDKKGHHLEQNLTEIAKWGCFQPKFVTTKTLPVDWDGSWCFQFVSQQLGFWAPELPSEGLMKPNPPSLRHPGMCEKPYTKRWRFNVFKGCWRFCIHKWALKWGVYVWCSGLPFSMHPPTNSSDPQKHL